jgi:hypothetical protein
MNKTNIFRIAMLLCIALVVAACGSAPSAQPTDDAVAAPAGEPAASPSLADEPTPEPSPTPASRDENGTLTFQIEGTQETVDAQLFGGSFGEGGPAFDLYVDTARYTFEGTPRSGQPPVYYVQPIDAASGDVTLEIQYMPDHTPASFIDGIYGDNENLVMLDAAQFGQVTAEHASASDDTMYVDIFALETEGGVVSLTIITSPENAEGHGARLLAQARSIVLR